MVGSGPAVGGCPQWVAVGKMREEGDEERRSQKCPNTQIVYEIIFSVIKLIGYRLSQKITYNTE